MDCDGIMLRLVGVTVCLMALAFFPGSASAYGFKTIYSFCMRANCPDGSGPEAGLLRGPNGSFYGGTTGGGRNGGGAIFKLTPREGSTNWKENVLYSFCRQQLCADGESPSGALITDKSGNLYGTTVGGGSNSDGEVFELNLTGRRPELKVLFSFCGEFDSCGFQPRTALTYAGKTTGVPYDGSSPLYGATSLGGANAKGVVFELIPPGKQGAWTEQVIYSLCSQPNCADGSYPNGDLFMDADGDLYGTADSGGATLDGTVFRLSFNEKKQNWKFTLLHSFCSGCGEGSAPNGALIADDRGRLFGTTEFGGAEGQGTAYRLVPKVTHSQLTVLSSFCLEANCTDGQNPFAGLTLGTQGYFFGTTSAGGEFSTYGGTVFELTQKNGQTVLHSFCALAQCADGQTPMGTLVSDSSGNLFGISFNGGAAASGTVFELSP